MDRTSRILLLSLISLLVIALAFPMALGGVMGMRAMQGQMSGPGMPGMGWSMPLVMGLGGLAALAFWVALIVGVALLVRLLSGPSRGQIPSSGETPLQILERRYASGELSEEEFTRMRHTLRGSASPDPPPGSAPEDLVE
jgi:putative membrane protein